MSPLIRGALLSGCVLVSVLQADPVASSALNRAPLARARADRLEVELGEAIDFDGSHSVDPDAGPSPLQHTWRFGDGSESAETTPSHRYAEPGVYDVTLRVSDGRAEGIATLTVFVLARPRPGTPTRSSALALSRSGDALWVVNGDAGSVSLVDPATARELDEIAVCSEPRTAALAPDAARLYVTCRDENVLAVLDAKTRRVLDRIALGHRPHGVAIASGTGLIVVTNQGDDSLSLIDPGDPSTARTLPVHDGPRGVAIDGGGEYAYVTHFISRGPFAIVTRVNLATGHSKRIRLAYDPSPDTDSSGGGRPNLLDAVAVDGAGRRVWVGGLKANVRGGLVANGVPFVATNRLRALLAPIHVVTEREQISARLDVNNADIVSAIALGPGDRYAFLAHRGSGRVSIYDLMRVAEQAQGASADGGALAFEARFDVGDAPSALALSPDAHTLFVLEEMSRSVSIVDVADVRNPVLRARVSVSAEPLSPVIARGKLLFGRSRSPEHTKDGYIACWSCHPDGGMDGQTWDLTQYGEGLRNTIDLRGRAGAAHGPLHWSANFDEVQDLEIDIVTAFGGTGLAQDGAPPHPPLGSRPNAGRSADLDALAAYVASLGTAPPSPHRAPGGGFTPDARAGKALFEAEQVGCADCHPAPRFTDSAFEGDPRQPRLHDVGTLQPWSGRRLGEPLVGLDTPSLLGLWDSAPYLHDGSAKTLEAVLRVKNPRDLHGRTSQLSDAEIAELGAYLMQIDGRGDASTP